MLIPYIFPLFLGMTYDARFSRPGIDIYEKKYVDDPLEDKVPSTVSYYKVASEMKDALSALGISGDLSLKIKSGMIDVAGKASYVKNEKNYDNSVFVITTLKYTSVVKTLKPEANPKDRWLQDYNSNALGTHYVNEIHYGAEMIASAKFVVHKGSSKNDIQGKIEGALSLEGEGVDLNVNGTLKKLAESLNGTAHVEISYYGTVPLKSIPNTIEGLETLINDFPQLVQESEHGEGMPIYVRLQPLENLVNDESEKEKFRFKQNELLNERLYTFETQLESLRQLRSELQDFARIQPYDLDDKYVERIGDLYGRMSDVITIFFETMWAIDLTKGPEQLDRAFNKANENKFFSEYMAIKRDIGENVKREESIASDTYIHWGHVKCNGTADRKLFDGFTFSSATGLGGVSSYDCSPKSVEQDYELSGGTLDSSLAGIRYAEMGKSSNPFKGKYKDVSDKGVPCAKCFSPASASISMFSAADKCPPSWELLYGGYLMSSKQNGFVTEYICVDDKPSKPYEMESGGKKYIIALTTVDSKESLPPKKYPNGSLIKCVVCSLTNNQVM